mmetsp:Transcript_111718/g.356450  ORF Transcript_111718/g.356450 Transcript_111718/m.356450 type:complete len:212 (-) Transcript_111718:196-831(-)
MALDVKNDKALLGHEPPDLIYVREVGLFPITPEGPPLLVIRNRPRVAVAKLPVHVAPGGKVAEVGVALLPLPPDQARDRVEHLHPRHEVVALVEREKDRVQPALLDLAERRTSPPSGIGTPRDDELGLLRLGHSDGQQVCHRLQRYGLHSTARHSPGPQPPVHFVKHDGLGQHREVVCMVGPHAKLAQSLHDARGAGLAEARQDDLQVRAV